LYYKGWDLHKPFVAKVVGYFKESSPLAWRTPNFAFPACLKCKKRGKCGCWYAATGTMISGMIRPLFFLEISILEITLETV
jgi:hypothetical protein